MFESVRLPKHPGPSQGDVHVLEYPLPEHPCPNYNNIHVREHPITRPSIQVPKTLRPVGRGLCPVREP